MMTLYAAAKLRDRVLHDSFSASQVPNLRPMTDCKMVNYVFTFTLRNEVTNDFGLYDELGNLFLWPAKNTVVFYFMLSLDPGNYG